MVVTKNSHRLRQDIHLRVAVLVIAAGHSHVQQEGNVVVAVAVLVSQNEKWVYCSAVLVAKMLSRIVVVAVRDDLG